MLKVLIKKKGRQHGKANGQGKHKYENSKKELARNARNKKKYYNKIKNALINFSIR